MALAIDENTSLDIFLTVPLADLDINEDSGPLDELDAKEIKFNQIDAKEIKFNQIVYDNQTADTSTYEVMGNIKASGALARRLVAELKAAKRLEVHDLVSARLVTNRDNCFLGVMFGPPGTPFDGGIFFLTIDCSTGYPFKPPIIRFVTKVYHPNVDKEGRISLNILEDDWCPALTLPTVLLSILSILNDPPPPPSGDGIESEIAMVRQTNYTRYERRVRRYTRKYATGEIPGDDLLADIIDQARKEEVGAEANLRLLESVDNWKNQSDVEQYETRCS